jgi:hypothetical protein
MPFGSTETMLIVACVCYDMQLSDFHVVMLLGSYGQLPCCPVATRAPRGEQCVSFVRGLEVQFCRLRYVDTQHASGRSATNVNASSFTTPISSAWQVHMHHRQAKLALESIRPDSMLVLVILSHPWKCNNIAGTHPSRASLPHISVWEG